MTTPTPEELLQACLTGQLPRELEALAATSTPKDQAEAQLAERVRGALEFTQLIQELALEAPPKGVTRATKRLSKQRLDLRTWIAKLWTPPVQLEPAFRGSAAAAQCYKAGPFELELLRSSSGALVGELMPEDPSMEPPRAGTCSLFGSDGIHSATLGAEGSFRFAELPPGNYRLVIELETDGEPELVVADELEL